MVNAIVPVIMCGGAGTRLWPLSTPEKPKPFHALAGGDSLFVQTLRRAEGLPFTSRPIVVAQAGHGALALAQAEGAGIAIDLVLEEEGHDTLVAALLGALAADAAHGPATMVLLSSDHYIPDRASFSATIHEACAPAGEGALVVLGITPRGPVPDYGYIVPASPDVVAPVRRFTEKPKPEIATRLIGEGALWNSGNFIVTTATLLSAAARLAPVHAAAARKAFDGRKNVAGGVHVTVPLQRGTGISIDRAIAEHFSDVRVVRATFAWSDVGTWDEVRRLNSKGGAYVRSGNIPVIVAGLEESLADDLIVVVTENGVLVTRTGQSDKLKQAVNARLASGQG